MLELLKSYALQHLISQPSVLLVRLCALLVGRVSKTGRGVHFSIPRRLWNARKYCSYHTVVELIVSFYYRVYITDSVGCKISDAFLLFHLRSSTVFG